MTETQVITLARVAKIQSRGDPAVFSFDQPGHVQVIGHRVLQSILALQQQDIALPRDRQVGVANHETEQGNPVEGGQVYQLMVKAAVGQSAGAVPGRQLIEMLGKEGIAPYLAVGTIRAGVADAHQACAQALLGEQLVKPVAQILAQHILLVFPGIRAAKTTRPVATVGGQRQHGLAGKGRIVDRLRGEFHKQRGHIAVVPAGAPAAAHQHLNRDSPLLASRAYITQRSGDVVAIGLPVGPAQGLEVEGQRQLKHAMVGKQGLAAGSRAVRARRLGDDCRARQHGRYQGQATTPARG